MAIAFPIALPSNGWKRVQFYAVTAVALSRSQWTFVTHVQAHPGEAWGADITLPLLQEAEARYWETFLLKLRGVKGSFLLGDPLRTAPAGVATGNPKVNGAGQAGEELITDGWTADTAGILLAGDYIQLGNRLHRVLNDVDSDSGGNATLDLFPRLRESPGDDTGVLTSSPKGSFRLAGSMVPTAEIGEDRLFSISFSAVEAI